jgi:glycosyltransferase involved in cell wall biosynthesis
LILTQDEAVDLIVEVAKGGVDLDEIERAVPLPGRLPGQASDDDFVIGYVGQLIPRKGVDVLLRAFAELRRRRPQARLRITGDGPERRRLQALVSELGLGDAVRISVGMRLMPGDVPAWFQELERAWALVAPSVHREPFGLVAAEALVHGVPVIATDGGGFAETVEPGISGLLVPRGDQASLKDALEGVADRRVFADHSVPSRSVELAQRRHDFKHHVALVREALGATMQAHRDPVTA